MRGRQILSLFALAVVIFAADPGVVAAQHRSVSGFVDDLTLDRYGMTRRWYTQVPTLRLREKTLSLTQREDLLFVSSDKGLLHCLDAETGQLLWSQAISDVPGEVFPPALTKNFVYMATGSKVSQIDRKTGQILFTLELPSAVTSGPAANEDYCFVQTIDNHISAIALKPDPDDASKVWPYKRKYTLPRISWFYDAGSLLSNPPIVIHDRVIFASANGVVYQSLISQRSLFYRFIPGSKISAPISYRAGTLYVATVNYNLYAIDMMTGEPLWRFPSGFPVTRQPVPFESEVFLTPDGGGLFSISNDDGIVRWVSDSVNRVVAVSQSRVYGMSWTNRFVILDREDGAVIGGWMSPDFPIAAYNQTTDRIFLATERGLIQCLAEAANVQPFLHEPISSEQESATPPEGPNEDSGDKEATEPDESDKEMDADESDDKEMDADRPSDEDMDADEELDADEKMEADEEMSEEPGDEPADEDKDPDEEMESEDSSEPR